MQKAFPWSLALLLSLASSVAAQAPAGEGPALGTNRLTQADVVSGRFTLKELRRKGLELFTTPFNRYDGFGDGPMDPFDPDRTSPGNRPTLQDNGTLLRVNGLDSQSCQECHGFLSTKSIPPRFAIAGAGGIASTAMPLAREIDPDDDGGYGYAHYDGRLVNPPFVFGAGGVELVAKEMTFELQGLKQTARWHPGYEIPLVTKGVDFGTISWDPQSGFDTSGVVGIDPDLVVRPFGRKGDNATVRAFSRGAIQFHQGMQPIEVVGPGTDPDGDGVTDEILAGELSALHLFGVALERPRQVGAGTPQAQSGAYLFQEIGCADCHVPSIDTVFRFLPVAFPEVESNPLANVYTLVDLAAGPGFERAGSGVRVPMFSDLKRHDMGPELAEATGSPLDPFFLTARLWGVADTAPYLHDGRALSLTEAIELHGGEAQLSADLFRNLADWQKVDLLTYLRTLRTPDDPSADLLAPAQN